MFRVTHNSERLGKNTDHRFSGGWGMEMQRVKFSSEILEFSSELVEISSELVEISSELVRISLELLIISTFKKVQGGIPKQRFRPETQGGCQFFVLAFVAN